MTLTLVLEHAPNRQQVQTYQHGGGELTIGRGDDAGWQIDDPEKFVSRQHCVISEQDGQFTVTDASSGGLFIDGANTPLGPGNLVQLEHGMRLRMGDYVVRVELGAGAAPTGTVVPKTQKPPISAGFEDDDFFSDKSDPVEPRDRPDTLPDPFEGSNALAAKNVFDGDPDQEIAPPQLDDVFTLEPIASSPGPQVRADPGTADPVIQPPIDPQPAAPTTQVLAAQSELVTAFFDGLGISEDIIQDADQAAEMRAIGKRFRLLVDGMIHLLRSRASERQNVRVAQTIIGAQDVNPLKFLANTDEALEALIKTRGKGYLDPDTAIEAAFRDLADHQVRTWSALQTALRRMIDKFDPEAIEKEMENTGLLEAMLAGGKNAKLWQLYEERYQRIAKAAEDRFLGEVGADFRDAYEQNRRK